MSMVERRFKTPNQEYKYLHGCAESYRKEQRETQKLEVMRKQVAEVGVPYQKLWNGMKINERKTIPSGEKKFIVVEKGLDHIKMAITTNPDKSLGGYLPPFSDIQDWQEIFMDTDGNGEEARVMSICHWDREQLNTYEKEPHNYLGLATVVQVNGLGELSSDNLARAYEDISKLIKVPDSLLAFPQQ